MNGAWVFIIGGACTAAMLALPKLGTQVRDAARNNRLSPEGARTHTDEGFSFTANGPLGQVAPLFGADKERVWAPGWDPQFVYPVPRADQQGMVFTTTHDHGQAVWVNTLFDEKSGRFQYVYVVPGALVTVIRIQLRPQGEQTKVDVEYDRTALSSEMDAPVRRMAEHDRASGPEWQEQINTYLTNASQR
jgi:hypothetical protein